MPIIRHEDTGAILWYETESGVAQKVQKLMAENGYPVPILDTPSEHQARYWAMFGKAITHIEDGTPKHFPNPARKIQIRYISTDTGTGKLPWRTVRPNSAMNIPPGWYAITPIGKIDGESDNLAVAHGPYSYRHAKSIVRQWLHNFWGPDGKNAQADFWLGEAEEGDIEVIRSAPESVAGIVVPGMKIHEIGLDKRDGRTMWDREYVEGK